MSSPPPSRTVRPSDGDPLAAGRFAHAAASLAVQGEGIDGIGTRAEIEAQVQREAAVGAG